jgi:hypothetical protein
VSPQRYTWPGRCSSDLLAVHRPSPFGPVGLGQATDWTLPPKNASPEEKMQPPNRCGSDIGRPATR